ncbi:MAG: hypothetical protein RSC71_03705 [Cetobacterium sp.]|uniref:RNA polymerase factor sigma-54 n=1 Tax=Cetobacterium sp. TaxID=2071632 RepID=UPI002FCBF59C
MNLNNSAIISQIQILKREQQLSINLLQKTNINLEIEITQMIEKNFFLQIDENNTKDNHKYCANISFEENKYRSEEKQTLKKFLENQLLEINVSKEILNCLKYLIGNLDDRGFLLLEFPLISSPKHLNILNISKKILLDLEPKGCGSKNINEFLDFQLKKNYSNYYTEKFKILIMSQYFNKIGLDKNLYKKLKIKKIDYENFLNILKNLKLYPTQNMPFFTEHLFIIPEASIFIENQDLVLELRKLPRVILNEDYINMKISSLTKEEKAFIFEKKREALDFINALNFRNRTIEKIITLITQKQKEYILKNSSLKPLILKDIAEALNLHISTVSRSLKDKYILMPNYKVKALKELLCKKINGQSCSEIKDKIKEIIEKEVSVISDYEIMQLLLKQGYDISRRSVAKYRKSLGILTLYKRKNKNGVKYDYE